MSALDQFKLTGQVAIVTGGGKGIGRATALAFADAGADVAVAARRANDVEEVAGEIKKRGRRALAMALDLRDPTAPARLIKEVKAKLGKINVLVNNAGGADDPTGRRLDETTEAHWDNVVELNFKAVWRCCKEVSAVMEPGGAIINISSIAAFRAETGYGPYSAAKAGANALTKTLSVELGARGIRVNSVAPGPVPTEMFLKGFGVKELDLKQLAKDWMVPIGRVGTPEDIANACLYFASPASSWTTGQVLIVSGGL